MDARIKSVADFSLPEIGSDDATGDLVFGLELDPDLIGANYYQLDDPRDGVVVGRLSVQAEPNESSLEIALKDVQIADTGFSERFQQERHHGLRRCGVAQIE